MEICVRQESPNQYGGRDHYCTALDKLPAVDFYLRVVRSSVPEFAAVELAQRYGCAPTIIDWVRPCPQCRDAFAESRLPVLRQELSVLAERLADDSRRAQARVRDLGEDIERYHVAMKRLEGTVSRLETKQVRERPRAPEGLGFVYLIGHHSAVKIGWSEKHPEERRLSQLQVASSEPLEILGLITAAPSHERELHNRFGTHRIRGEWFTRAEEILAYFRENGIVK